MAAEAAGVVGRRRRRRRRRIEIWTRDTGWNKKKVSCSRFNCVNHMARCVSPPPANVLRLCGHVSPRGKNIGWEEYWVASFFILQRRGGGGDNEDFSLGGFLALSLDHCEVGKAKKPPKLKATGFVIEVMAVSHSRPFPIFCNSKSRFLWKITVVGCPSPRVFLAPLTASRLSGSASFNFPCFE